MFAGSPLVDAEGHNMYFQEPPLALWVLLWSLGLLQFIAWRFLSARTSLSAHRGWKQTNRIMFVSTAGLILHCVWYFGWRQGIDAEVASPEARFVIALGYVVGPTFFVLATTYGGQAVGRYFYYRARGHRERARDAAVQHLRHLAQYRVRYALLIGGFMLIGMTVPTLIYAAEALSRAFESAT